MQLRHRLKKTAVIARVFGKWIAIGIAVGVCVGSVGTLFHFLLEQSVSAFHNNLWLIVLLPLAGATTVFLYHISGMENDQGANLILHWIRAAHKRPPARFAPLIFIATILTQLCGGSAGREGAALQIGGCLGAWMGKFFRLDQNDMRVISMCGMSAAFAAVFATPVTAVVLAMEVISIGVMYYAAVVPCTVASVIGFSISCFFGTQPPFYSLVGVAELDLIVCLQVALLGVLCALLSRLLCFLLRQSVRWACRYFPCAVARILLGGCIVVGLTLLCQTDLYNGAGMSIVDLATRQSVGWEVFALKILFTVVTISAGYKGGEIVPTFAIGASFGAVAGSLLGLSSSFGAGLGLVAMFCGVLNCPLTSLVLSVELFGTQGMVYFMLAIAISYMLSGYSGLYSEQRILYSKLKTKFINRKTGG